MILALLLTSLATPLQVPCTLATDDTIATIEVSGDRSVLTNLRNVADPHNWCANSTTSLFDKVWLGNEEESIRWSLTKYEVAGEPYHAPEKLHEGAGPKAIQHGATLTVTWTCAQPSMQLRSIWRARRGRGPIEHWIEIDNKSGANITVPQQESLNLDSLDPGGESAVWWIWRGASNALTEGGTFQNPVKAGLDLNLVSDHHDPTSPVPWISIQVGNQRGLYVGWEFSSRGRVEATAASSPSLSVRAGLLPDFKTDIHPGETLTIPTAFVGCYKGGIDEGSQSLHKFIMEKLRANPPKDFADPTTVCGIYLDAGGDKATEATLLPTIAFAKSLNLDTFLADAMWFPACGDWRWDPARFPHGVTPIREAIHAGGMKFGLWCAWNNGGISTDPGALSVRGPVGHPDWFGQDLPPDWHPGPFYGVSADMGSPEAKAWALEKTQSMADEMGFDFLKTDVHPMISDCIRTDHRHSHGTDVGYWSTLGVYEVWDQLRKKHPKLVLENCSGASHIKDFGVIQRCAYTATTDTLSNLPDRAGIYDSTFVLPPAALMTYTYEDGYNLPGDKPGPYLFRSGMMSAWDLAPTDSKDWTEEEKAAGRAATRTYREWLRPIMKDCVVHHVLPRPDGKHWDGMFYWSEKLRKGTLFIFRPDTHESVHTVKLAGLAGSKHYLVWDEDGSFKSRTLSGSELMDKGVPIRLPGRYTSDMIHLQDASLPKPADWGKPGEFHLKPTKTERTYFGAKTTLSWTPSRGARCYRVSFDPNDDAPPHIPARMVFGPSLVLDSPLQGGYSSYTVAAYGWGGARLGGIGDVTTPGPLLWPGQFVSDLAWIKAEAGSGQVHRDETYNGRGLSIAGKLYRKGVWTHSFNDGRPADLVLDIADKGFGTFASDAGLDDASGGGSIQFQVLADGKLPGESPVMKPHEVFHFKVDITSVHQLTLRVLNGGDGYDSDHADWGLARLIKAGAKDPFAAQTGV